MSSGKRETSSRTTAAGTPDPSSGGPRGSKKAKSSASSSSAPKRAARFRNCCFTIFEEAEEFYTEWKEKDLPSSIKYLVYQLETCPETKQIHVQGYVEFSAKQQLTLEGIKCLFERLSMHIEQRKGTAAEAAAYCKKDDTRVPGVPYVERGTISQQGRRSDLEGYAARVAAGGEAAIQAVASEAPQVFVRYYRGLQALAAYTSPPAMRPRPSILYMWGRPGCGKSRLAHNMFPEAYCATDKKEGWFDGYRGQDTIIFDDFEGNYPLREMLKLLDFNSLQLPVKGAFVPIRAYRFIFTSNMSPATCYDTNSAWMRRIEQFGKVWEEEKIIQKYEAAFGPLATALHPLETDDFENAADNLAATQPLEE